MLEVITYREIEPMGDGTSYAGIEVRSNESETFIYSQLFVTNGASWAIDPATVERRASLEDAAASFGLKFADFEECDRQEYVY